MSRVSEFAESVDPIAVRDQIDKILRSHSFASKGQLRKLLEILFKNIDSQSALKPDLVIQELWPAETRTKRAADVATEMNRLRHALKSYYNDEGKIDPIIIHLPNRSAPSANGPQVRSWIAAIPRADGTGQLSAHHPHIWQANPGKALILLIGLALLGSLIFISIRILGKHDPPQSARLDGTVLRIMDADGKELWSKSFRDGFWPEYYQQGVAPRIWFGDLEGKGRTDVLLLYHSAVTPRSHSSTLICYSDRGEEKWRWTPGRDLPELQGAPATYRSVALVVLKAVGKKPRRIVVSSFNDPWWPNQIALLDTNGKTISEYWHSGHLDYLTLADLDGDGHEEIVATGIANGYRQATMIVLDPDRIFGASAEAARPQLEIHGMGAAQERLRLLFTRSDLNKALFVYNAAGEATVSNGNIQLSVKECLQPPGCLMWYKFDRHFNLVADYADEQFRSAHEAFYAKGKDAHKFGPEEQTEFDKVRCLVGCKTGFVPEHLN
ncbi:MAG: hypothetical protein WBE13_15470 [Candidatus Acidiferrum sp.]